MGEGAGLWLVGIGFAALLLIGVAGLAAREVTALLRQGRIAELHAELARAHSGDDRTLARAAVVRLIALYQRALKRPARARNCNERWAKSLMGAISSRLPNGLW